MYRNPSLISRLHDSFGAALSAMLIVGVPMFSTAVAVLTMNSLVQV